MKVMIWLQAAQLFVVSLVVVILLAVVVPLLRESNREKDARFMREVERETEKKMREFEKTKPEKPKGSFTG